MVFLFEGWICSHNLTRTVRSVGCHPYGSFFTARHNQDSTNVLSWGMRFLREIIGVALGCHIMERCTISTLHRGQTQVLMNPSRKDGVITCNQISSCNASSSLVVSFKMRNFIIKEEQRLSNLMSAF